MQKINIIIVGQGIAGTLLGLQLMGRGFSVRIFDPGSKNTSSQKAGGLYNPITGRKMVKTWLADELFSGLPEFYSNLEQKLNQRFHYPIPIYRPFFSMEEQNDWNAKLTELAFAPFIKEISQRTLGIRGLQDQFGGLELQKTGFVDLPSLLSAARDFFIRENVLIGEKLDFEQLEVNQKVTYGNYEAEKLISCEGTFVSKNPFWNQLPFKPVRGEVLDILCDLPTDKIYNRGLFMLPRDGFFRVGSTYHHDVLSFEPQENGIEELKRRLTKLFNGQYEIIGASAGVRPATHDRRPYIGWHHENKAVGIFNGFGAKGVSLVPYFSKLFVDSIEGTADIHPEADVSRVF